MSNPVDFQFDKMVISAQIGPGQGPMPDEPTMRKIIDQEMAKGRLIAFTGSVSGPDRCYMGILPGERWKPVFKNGRFTCYERDCT